MSIGYIPGQRCSPALEGEGHLLHFQSPQMQYPDTEIETP